MKHLNDITRELHTVFAQGNTFIRAAYQGQTHIVPVTLQNDVRLADLLGIEAQKTAVLTNTTRFLQGKPYNHMLLWGARGTGKSSLVRAVLSHLQAQGLKALQLSCDDLTDLPFLLWVLGQQDAHFLLYIDDLSFSGDDARYRTLKAALDGTLSGIAANILLCVTSNRRHLLSESHQDEQALHPDEDIEENISLAERFGLRLAFHPLSQAQYLEIVFHWLNCPPDAGLSTQALQFALARGSRSARVARQFIRTLI